MNRSEYRDHCNEQHDKALAASWRGVDEDEEETDPERNNMTTADFVASVGKAVTESLGRQTEKEQPAELSPKAATPEEANDN